MGEAEIPADRAIFPLVLRQAHRRALPEKRIAVKRGLKYIEGHEAWGDSAGLLFDLAESPGEEHNVREQREVDAASLAADIDAYRSSLTPGRPVHQKTGKPVPPEAGATPGPAELSDEQRQRLKQLGYL